jgi:nitroreductase
VSEPAGFFDVARAQRAHRSFTTDPVPDDDLTRILEAATWAPSAENSQPWVFVVVRDPERRGRLDDLTRRLWEQGGRASAQQRVTAPVLADVDRATASGFGGAPVIVVVAGDTTRCLRAALSASVFPAVQNLLLAAGALGYGTALTTLATFGADEVRSIVGCAEHLQPLAVVPVGRPGRELGPSRREPVSARAHLDRFGQAFPPD